MLSMVVDAHPRIACPPESKFLMAFVASLSYPQALQGLGSIGIGRDEVVAAFGEVARRWFDAYARKQGKARWADKTPNYYRILGLIDAMFSGEVLFVFLVRHPLDTVSSLLEFEPIVTRSPEDPELAGAVWRYGVTKTGLAMYWLEVYSRIMEFYEGAMERCHVVRYEDIVCQPKASVQSLCHFVGEEYPDGLEEAAWSRRRPQGYGDQKARLQTAIHPNSLGRWRCWPRAEACRVWVTVEGMAQRLGYDLGE